MFMTAKYCRCSAEGRWVFVMLAVWGLISAGRLSLSGETALAVESPPPLAARSNAVANPFPADFRRVVFLGDSITYAGDYVSDITAWSLTRYSEHRLEMINVGLPSETVSGLSEPGHAGGKFPRPDLHERLARVLAQTKPNLVFACYGMNDGIYLPFDAARFKSFRDGMVWLHNSVEAFGAQIIHVTPPVFDEARGGHAGYSAVLDLYSAWLISQRTNGWQVIDCHGPMKRVLAAEREKDPAFAFAVKDGIHPDSYGHWVMAQAILAGLGATDVAADGSAAAMMAGVPHGLEILGLVREQQAIMKDAWLTAVGSKRPMKAGLPLAQARARAAEIEKRLSPLLIKDAKPGA